ncbi:hypothetical protein TSUD_214380 [Trifolium subterraneum]|uniref:peroxidase n=1 Tax=Trifolium subterraneum TaxID=3900 RepID=A0A2Z6MXT6_TRISU|nr:hypothetical protein TSUD_214380 [Trifolium subterraneum]
MDSRIQFCLVIFMVTLATILSPTLAKLTPNYYDRVCPKALPIIKSLVKQAIYREPRIGASLLRLHFHDCFVNLGGNQYWYKVLLGRRDARNASWAAANANLPPPFFNFSQLITSFQSHGLNLKDLVVLSGAHTIGFAKCSSFRDRIFNDTNIDNNFAANLRKTCPRIGGDTNLAPLDSTPTKVDTTYYKSLLYKKGLLHSDQELYKGDGSQSDRLVQLYSKNPYAFAKDFGVSMIKMGNLKPLTGRKGEIRCNCRKVNNY